MDFSLWRRAQEYANDIREFIGDYSTSQGDRFNNIERKLSYSVTYGPQNDSLDFLEEENDNLATLSGTDWDSIINEFSDIVDAYIDVFNEYQKGVNYSAEDISNYLDKISALSKMLAKADDNEITSEQKNRIIALSEKLNNL